MDARNSSQLGFGCSPSNHQFANRQGIRMLRSFFGAREVWANLETSDPAEAKEGKILHERAFTRKLNNAARAVAMEPAA